jgi:hypothetical protein
LSTYNTIDARVSFDTVKRSSELDDFMGSEEIAHLRRRMKRF